MSAQHFYKMAQSYAADGSSLVPKLYTLCVSIELGLKAGLRAADHSLQNKARIRREIGHDLLKAADEFEVIYGRQLTDQARDTIGRINEMFAKKDLEYFEPPMLASMMRAYTDLPNVDEMLSAAGEVMAFLASKRHFL